MVDIPLPMIATPTDISMVQKQGTQTVLTIETVQKRDFIYLGIRLEIRLCSVQLPCFCRHFIGAPMGQTLCWAGWREESGNDPVKHTAFSLNHDNTDCCVWANRAI
jgi:hypothetical protein